jgi:hypothetical protein
MVTKNSINRRSQSSVAEAKDKKWPTQQDYKRRKEIPYRKFKNLIFRLY